MHPTKNDLPEPTRAAVAAGLSARLADMIDLFLQSKHLHWNYKGWNFIAVHELLDKVAEAAEDASDEIAERIAALGGAPDGRSASVAKKSSLPELAADGLVGRKALESFVATMAKAGAGVRKGIDEMSSLGDQGSSDMLTAISRELDKNLWFVESHLQGE